MANASNVPKLYQTVVDDVISNVSEYFLDDGVDDQVLQELKQLWQSKLSQSKVLQKQEQAPAAPQQAQLVTQRPAAPGQQHAATAFHTQMPTLNPNSQGIVEMSSAAQTATLSLPPALYPQQLAALGHQTITVTQGGQQYIIQAAPGHLLPAGQPGTITTSAGTFTLNTQVPSTADPQALQRMVQLDGANDSSSDDDDDDDDDGDDKDDDEQNDNDGDGDGEEEEPLNSNDDVSSEEEGPTEVFDTESVVVCQFDKINRNKNKWKFHLKDGIMNLNGTDYVFQKALGEAEW